MENEEFKVGDRVWDLFRTEGRKGTILLSQYKKNNIDQWVCQVKWDNDSGYNPTSQHPKYLRHLTPLEDLL